MEKIFFEGIFEMLKKWGKCQGKSLNEMNEIQPSYSFTTS